MLNKRYTPSRHQSSVDRYARSQTKADFIERLTQLPQQVYRVKGFVRFTDSKLIHLVQYAEGEIELTPIQFKSDVPLYLVVIGKHLDAIELDL